MGISMPEQPQLFDLPEEPSTSRKDKKRKNYLTPVSPGVILQIWDLYCETFWTGKGRKPRLSDERAKLITVAVNQYGADMVKQAVRGCSLSPWHMGQNPTGTRYTDIELILRDAGRIEKFASLTVAYDNGGGFLDEE